MLRRVLYPGMRIWRSSTWQAWRQLQKKCPSTVPSPKMGGTGIASKEFSKPSLLLDANARESALLRDFFTWCDSVSVSLYLHCVICFWTVWRFFLLLDVSTGAGREYPSLYCLKFAPSFGRWPNQRKIPCYGRCKWPIKDLMRRHRAQTRRDPRVPLLHNTQWNGSLLAWPYAGGPS